MWKKVLYASLSVGFFITLLLAVMMVTDLLFNSSETFFDRMGDVTNFFRSVRNI